MVEVVGTLLIIGLLRSIALYRGEKLEVPETYNFSNITQSLFDKHLSN